MSERNYRRVLGIVVAICILLAVALGYVLLRNHRTARNGRQRSGHRQSTSQRAGRNSAGNDERSLVRRLCAQSHTGTAVAAAPTSNRCENGSSRDASAQ